MRENTNKLGGEGKSNAKIEGTERINQKGNFKLKTRKRNYRRETTEHGLLCQTRNRKRN